MKNKKGIQKIIKLCKKTCGKTVNLDAEQIMQVIEKCKGINLENVLVIPSLDGLNADPSFVKNWCEIKKLIDDNPFVEGNPLGYIIHDIDKFNRDDNPLLAEGKKDEWLAEKHTALEETFNMLVPEKAKEYMDFIDQNIHHIRKNGLKGQNLENMFNEQNLDEKIKNFKRGQKQCVIINLGSMGIKNKKQAENFRKRISHWITCSIIQNAKKPRGVQFEVADSLNINRTKSGVIDIVANIFTAKEKKTGKEKKKY